MNAHVSSTNRYSIYYEENREHDVEYREKAIKYILCLKKEKEIEMHRRACVYVRIHTYTKATNALSVRPPSKSHIKIYIIYI